jgi:hypothetical protein
MPSIINSDNGVSSGSAGLKYSADSSGVLELQTNGTTAMTVSTGQNVGIGTGSPGAKLDVVGTSRIASNSDPYALILRYNTSTNGFIIGSPSADAMSFSNSVGTERMRLDSSGNLGLGVTPSAWAGTTTRAIQIGTTGGASLFNNSTGNVWLLSNAFFDGSNFKYVNSTFSSAYAVNNGVGDHRWYIAPSGTAGNAITFTQAMTLNASGYLGIGDTNPSNPLAVSASAASTRLVSFYDTSSGSSTPTTGLIIHKGGANIGDASPSLLFDVGGGGGRCSMYSIRENGFGGNLVFATDNTSGTRLERMRIDSSGGVLIGTTDSGPTSGVGFKFSASSTIPALFNVFNTDGGGNTYHLYNTNATNNGYRFYVFVNGGIANYSGNNVNISDERTKNNIELSGSYLDKICAIPVKLFNYKDEAEGEQRTLGVIAQDVEAVAPEFVNNDGWEGTSPEDGVPLKTIYTTDMMFGLMKAIQELKAEVDSLKAQLQG